MTFAFQTYTVTRALQSNCGGHERNYSDTYIYIHMVYLGGMQGKQGRRTSLCVSGLSGLGLQNWIGFSGATFTFSGFGLGFMEQEQAKERGID